MPRSSTSSATSHRSPGRSARKSWFYLAYPVLLLASAPAEDAGSAAAAYVVHCVVAVALVGFVSLHFVEISEFALQAFGEIADGRGDPGQDSLFRWLLYFSPYSRILEFIAGCLAAQLYISLADRPVGPKEQVAGIAISGFAVAFIVFSQIFIFAPDLLPFHAPAGDAISENVLRIRAILRAADFLLRALQNAITAPLSWRPIVLLGEASYSIYLLHMAFFPAFRQQPVEATAANIVLHLGIFCGISALLRHQPHHLSPHRGPGATLDPRAVSRARERTGRHAAPARRCRRRTRRRGHCRLARDIHSRRPPRLSAVGQRRARGDNRPDRGDHQRYRSHLWRQLRQGREQRGRLPEAQLQWPGGVQLRRQRGRARRPGAGLQQGFHG